MSALSVLQLALAIVVAIDAFGRLVRTTARTVPTIRHAFALLFAAAILMAGATAAGAVQAAWPIVLLLLALLAVQLATSRYWRHGPPPQFQAPPDDHLEERWP